VEVAVFSAQGESSVLPWAGHNLARARGEAGLALLLKGEADRLTALSKPDLWALDPELAGWNAWPSGARE
jgi:hypothetical protein